MSATEAALLVHLAGPVGETLTRLQKTATPKPSTTLRQGVVEEPERD